MARFSLNRPVKQETFTATPNGQDPMTFVLDVIGPDNMIDYIAFNSTNDYKAMLKHKLALATGRIVGWEGVVDEENNELKFSLENLYKLLELREFLPYLFLVADHTIATIQAEEAEEADKLKKGKPAKALPTVSKQS